MTNVLTHKLFTRFPMSDEDYEAIRMYALYKVKRTGDSLDKNHVYMISKRLHEVTAYYLRGDVVAEVSKVNSNVLWVEEYAVGMLTHIKAAIREWEDDVIKAAREAHQQERVTKECTLEWDFRRELKLTNVANLVATIISNKYGSAEVAREDMQLDTYEVRYNKNDVSCKLDVSVKKKPSVVRVTLTTEEDMTVQREIGDNLMVMSYKAERIL